VPVAPESIHTELSVFARTRGPALFWRLAIGNAAVLAAACAITAFALAPRAEDIALRELAIFVGGFVVILALNLLLLRRALGPLRQLALFARTIDPLEPGPRVEIAGGDSEASALATAFNEMLERLEVERRDSVRRALAAQEGERLRVAQEQGELRPDADLDVIVDQLWGACYHRLLVLRVPFDESLVPRLVDQALHGAAAR